jgi:uncharacterized membrane protein YciS (DUF1049 family)
LSRLDRQRCEVQNPAANRTREKAMATSFGILYLLGAVFVVVLAICWIVLPFALIGTKPLLRKLIAEIKRNNELLDQRLPALRPSRAPDA